MLHRAAVVLLAVLVTSASGGLTLCRGGDGHVAVEPAAFGHRQSTHACESHHVPHDDYACTAHENTCRDVHIAFDIDLSVGPDERSAGQVRALRAAGDQAPSVGRRLPWRTRQAQRVLSHAPLPPPHLSYLRAVVLLV